jgi:hypothetical protein
MTTRPPRRRSTRKNDDGTLKVRFRGRDDAPLSIADLRQGLYQLASKLEPYGREYRAKRATLYLVLVDEHGDEVHLNNSGEMSIFPYQSAADEHGV